MSTLKKLWSDYGIGGILLLIIVAYSGTILFRYFNSKGNSGMEQMTGNTNTAYGGNSQFTPPQPSEPLGQNEVYAALNNGQTTGQGVPSSCNKPNIQNPDDLLPKDNNGDWAQLNPSGKGELANMNLLKAGYHIGINTISSSLRNANQQIRSEPPNPQVNTGIWNQSTIEPDFMRPPLEVGQGGQ